MLTINLKPHRNPATIGIEFVEGDTMIANAVFTHAELVEAQVGVFRQPAVAVWDIGRVVLCRAWDIAIIRPFDSNATGKFVPDAARFDIDTVKLLRAAHKLAIRNAALPRRKHGEPGKGLTDWQELSQSIPIDRFRREIRQAPPLTINQMVNHKNVPDRRCFLETLASFRKSLSQEWWNRLREVLNRYLPHAQIFGQGPEEFYFDGRKLGLGFNGGIILRGSEFSTHT